MRKFESYAGSRINGAIALAIDEARKHSDTVEFEFNGVTVQVAGDSNPELILRDWWRGMLRPSNTFTVEPYPPVELSAEQLAEDKRLTDERDERQRVRQAEYDKSQAIKTATLQGALASAPPLALRDVGKWQSWVDANSDGYGAACVRYAEKWGRLMQARMPQGLESAQITRWLVDNAEECSSVADDEGITGFMYGAAVSMLAGAWEHGEELRRWHNLKTQIKDEGERANKSGGVLNPAVLSIG
jgi:hypothetical protein